MKKALCEAGVSCATVIVVWLIVDALGGEVVDNAFRGALSGCLAAAASSLITDYVCNNKPLRPFCDVFIGAASCILGVIVGTFQNTGGMLEQKDPNAIYAWALGVLASMGATINCPYRWR
jgi:hypothetical protein